MSIIVEDGTGVAGANSYASIIELTNYIRSRGVSDLQKSSDLNRALTSGTLFVDKRESRFLGSKANPFQALCWPRKDVSVDDVDLEDNVIPDAVKTACLESAFITLSNDPMAHNDGKNLTRERIEGVIDQQFDVSKSGFSAPSVDVLLTPVMKRSTFTVSRA